MSAPGNMRAVENTRANWETPPELFAVLDDEFGFDLDAAASETNTKCKRWLEGPHIDPAICSCGLCTSWAGDVVFCNPPYGAGLERWIDKFIKESREATIVAVLPANTDTRWFAKVAANTYELRLLTGRVQFLLPGGVRNENGNPGGTMVAVFATPANHREISVWDWRKCIHA